MPSATVFVAQATLLHLKNSRRDACATNDQLGLRRYSPVERSGTSFYKPQLFMEREGPLLSTSRINKMKIPIPLN